MPVGNYRPLTLTPINFSLTDGTSIPAPPDSPPDSPRPPTPGAGPLSSHPTPKSAVFPQHRDSPPRARSEDSVPEQEEEEEEEDQDLRQVRTNGAASSMLSPVSPPSRRPSPPRRPSSVRNFWGMRTLSSSENAKSERPGSSATIQSQAPSLSRRKSGNWFGKKKVFAPGNGGMPEQEKVTAPANGYVAPRPVPAPVVQTPQPTPITQPKRRDPPPPALPELRSFGVSEDSLSLGADDMFKDIK
ncbi:hypothetical protein P153DRAFT_363374 [Dothidotthia symphoricarpi CBS 119687]|uniref:Uncharacterized protein n=1 Tax=Dothidotthia symphoricarpi CBS 119687 TaxID=1392245 RepID=A0A6A6ANP5_9PLEO|nr:uncharacterized protein P153DRAFT_363374 [Dothidotthia symphoricarpi CBS 119687]KAF2133156.1 hypothetical protein P153DRAFT_363374 [Dothidotthia symphoricarpi CBS 119687]